MSFVNFVTIILHTSVSKAILRVVPRIRCWSLEVFHVNKQNHSAMARLRILEASDTGVPFLCETLREILFIRISSSAGLFWI
jgi:hypothetical protein